MIRAHQHHRALHGKISAADHNSCVPLPSQRTEDKKPSCR